MDKDGRGPEPRVEDPWHGQWELLSRLGFPVCPVCGCEGPCVPTCGCQCVPRKIGIS